MRIYGKVKIAFWYDQKIIATDDSVKLLALYCKTGKHSNAIGCYRLPLGYIQTDLGWSTEKAKTCLQTLIAIGFIKYDEETQFLFMPDYLEENPIENSRVGKMCVDLVNDVMCSSTLFPHLIEALNAHKHRFIFKEKNWWEPKWDTVSGNAIQTTDTVSSGWKDFVPTEPKPEPDPEPETEPETEPEPEPEYTNNHNAREENLPLAIIKSFDEVIITVFGKDHQRPWPHTGDMEIAQEFVKAGADTELCRQLFLKQQVAHKRKNQSPIGNLAYFRDAVPDAVAAREYYQNNPLPENHYEQRTSYARSTTPRYRNGHDIFTEALVEVVCEREQH